MSERFQQLPAWGYVIIYSPLGTADQSEWGISLNNRLL